MQIYEKPLTWQREEPLYPLVMIIKPEFKNDENLNELVIIIPRLDENGNQVTKSDEKSNQVQDENGNQVRRRK